MGDAARLSGGGPRGACRQPRRVQAPKSRLLRPSSVPGIEAARGYQVSGNGFVGENILFADGSFLYLISGEGSTVGQKKAPTRADLVAAVSKLHARVHSHAAHTG